MFEQETITYLNNLVTSGVFLDGSIIGISENLKTARALVTVLVNNQAKQTHIFIKKSNEIYEWFYLTPKDIIENDMSDTTGWHYTIYAMRLIAPKALLELYPAIALQMMIRNLPIVENTTNNTYILYMNYISQEHQAIIDANPGLVIEYYNENQ